MPRFSRTAFVFLFTAFLGVSSTRAESVFGPKWPPVVSHPGSEAAVTWGELENGFRYAIVPSAAQGRDVAVRLLVAAGREQEPSGKAGLSYVLAESFAGGTKEFSRDAINAFLLANGMALNPETLYKVDLDTTVYRLDLREPDDGALETAIALMGDVAAGPTGTEAEHSTLRKLIKHRAEFGYGRYFPDQARLEETLSKSNRYERLGDPRVAAEIAGVTDADLAAYHDSWYTPDRMLLVLSGTVDAEGLKPRLEERFGGLEGASSQVWRSPEKDSRLREGGEVYSEISRDAFARLTISNVQSMPNRYDPEAEKRLYVLDFLARYAQKLSTNASRLGGQGVAILGNHVAMQVERRGTFINMLDYLVQCDKAVHQLVEYGIRQEELDAAKQDYLGIRDGFDLMLSTREHPAILADRLVESVLKSIPFRRGEDLARFIESIVSSLDYERTRALCAEVFRLKDLSYLVELPDGFELNSKTIAKKMKAVRKGYDFTWEGAGEIPQDYNLGAGFQSNGMVESTELLKLDQYSALQYEFSNNVRLNLVRTEEFPGRMQIHLAIGNGINDLEQPNAAFVALARSLLLEMKVGSGVQALTMKKILEAKGLSSADAGVKPGELYWSAEGESEEQLASFLSSVLVWLVTSQLDEDDFDDQKEALGNSIDQGVTGNSLPRLERALYGEDERLRTYFDKDELDAISFSDFNAWLRSARETGYIEITVVGNAVPRTLLRDVRKTFGSAPVRTGKVMQPRHAKAAQWGEPGIVDLEESMPFKTGYVTLLYPVVEDRDCSNRFRQNVFRPLLLAHAKRVLADYPQFAESLDVTVEGVEMIPGSEAMRLQVRATPEEAAQAETMLKEVAESFAASFDAQLFRSARRSVWVDLRLLSRNLRGLVDLFNQSQGRPNALDCTLKVLKTGLSGNLDTYREVAAKQFSSDNVRGAVVMPE